MAIAYVQKSTLVETNASGGGNPSGPSLTGVASGACLIVTGSVYNGTSGVTISSVSDGSSYTVRSAVHGDSYKQYDFVAYLVNASSGTHTVTVSLASAGTNTYAVIGMSEFSGVATSSPEDTWDANDGQGIDTNDVNAGPITTTDAGALIIGTAGLAVDSATDLAWSSPSSWTNLFAQGDGFTSGTGHNSGYWLPGSTQSTYTAQWAHRNFSGLGAAVVVALKAAAGGSQSNAPRAMHQARLRS